jgi:hypothetical protein
VFRVPLLTTRSLQTRYWNMVRFKNRYFVVEIIWHDALEAPSTRPPQDITRSLLLKTLQVRPRPRCCLSMPARTRTQTRARSARQESVLRNFGEVGAGNLLSGMTVKHFNPIASIFIARKLCGVSGCIVRLPTTHALTHRVGGCLLTRLPHGGILLRAAASACDSTRVQALLGNSHRNLPCRGQ